jgi:hypothetical protein
LVVGVSPAGLIVLIVVLSLLNEQVGNTGEFRRCWRHARQALFAASFPYFAGPRRNIVVTRVTAIESTPTAPAAALR